VIHWFFSLVWCWLGGSGFLIFVVCCFFCVVRLYGFGFGIVCLVVLFFLGVLFGVGLVFVGS